MKTKIRSIVFLVLVELIYAIVQEFTGKTFTSSDITNWTQKPVHLCGNTNYQEFANSNVFGIFGKTVANTKKTINSLQPHWSVSIRFDMLLYQSLDGNDYVNIQADTQVVQTFKKNGAGDGGHICGTNYGDVLIMYNKNFTHSSTNLSLNIDSIMDEVEGNEGFVLKNLFIYIDTCHQSCATCSGPNFDQCLSCPTNASQSGNICSCNKDYLSYQYTCVTTCPTGFVPDSSNKICVVDFCSVSDCQTCVNKICTICKSGKKLLLGQCISSCPSYAPEISGVCKDISSNLINGKYLLKGLFSDNFGESEISGLGLITNGFLGTAYLTETSAKVSRCGDKNLLGGAYLSSTGSSISRQFSGLDPHWSIVIGYTLYKIDTWDNERVDLYVDGAAKIQTQRAFGDGTASLCGLANYNDDIVYASQNFTHTASNMNIQISTTLNQNPYDESYGIREIFILVDYCTSNCVSCDASGCKSCKTGYYLYQNTCHAACPVGSFANSSTTCASCDSSCKECINPGTNKSCTQCNSGTYLNPDKSCQSTCPISYWQRTSDLTCQSCDSTCYSCKSPGDANSCLACSGSLYLDNNQCVSQCGTSYVKVPATNNNTCQKCESSCLTCDGVNSNNCLTCKGPSLFWQQTTKTCVTSCNPNQYKNGTNQQCTSCESSCATCSGNLNNNCLSCTGNLFLDSQTNKCVSSCPDNYFNNTTNNKCTSCESTCATCNGGASNQCLACNLPRYFQSSTKQCVSTCNSNQYKDDTSKSCQNCDSTCNTCSGGKDNNCLTCTGNLYLDKTTNKCLSQCPSNYFANTQNNECNKCEISCKTCDGGSNSNCLSCNLPKYYQPLAKQCVGTCNSNQYQDDTSISCKNCSSSCATCKGGSNLDCLSCSGILYLDPFESKCVPNCPNNFYPNTSNNKCTKCDNSCATCDGGEENNCLSCSSPLYHQPLIKQCVPKCNSNQYQDDSSVSCKMCESSCSTCSGGFNNNCLSCAGLLFLDSDINQCVPNCPDTYFNNKINNKCSKCDNTCATCNGDSDKSCLTCNLPRYYQSNKKQCVSDCNSNQYQDKDAIQCKNCDPTCKSCSGGNSNNCLSCSGTLFLDKSKHICVQKCPNNYYPDNSNNECTICDSTCATCDGGSDSNCLTCSGDRFYQKSAKQCVLQCNKNQYKNTVSQECNSCDQSCASCEGPQKNQCLSCSESLFLDQQNKQCVSICSDGFYANKTNNECSKCDQTCKTCDNGTNSKDCLSCDGIRFHIIQTKECTPQCPISYYGEVDPVRQCLSCHYKCRTGCYGPDAEECDTIKVQYQMLFYILSFKFGLWIFSFVWGIFKDRKIDRFLAVVKPESPIQGDDQKDKDQNQEEIKKIESKKLQKKVSIDEEIKVNQDNNDGTFNNIELFSKQQTMINLNLNQNNINDCEPEKLQKKQSMEIESKVNIDGTLNNIDLYSKQQTMTHLNQNNGFGVEPASRRKFRRMRSHKLTFDTSRSNTIILDSPALMASNPLKKMSSDIDSDQAITLSEGKQKYTQSVTRNTFMSSSIFRQKSQENVKIKLNQKLKFTIVNILLNQFKYILNQFFNISFVMNGSHYLDLTILLYQEQTEQP